MATPTVSVLSAPAKRRESGRGTLDLQAYLDNLERQYPGDIFHVTEPVDPARFGVTAVLQHLEDRDRYPLVVFDRPLNLLGEVSAFPLVTNVYAARERCALAIGLRREQAFQDLGLEYARREGERIDPTIVSPGEAPVKDVVDVGDLVDLRRFPVVRHHKMDGGPYIDMTAVMRDPDSGAYNTAFLRTQFKGPRKLGIHMSPQHSWRIASKNERVGKPTPVVIVVSHHPAFHIGALNGAAFGEDDYHVIGSIAGKQLRLVASETWGDGFLVPADADIVIEGEIPPDVREVEGPFGEFPGTYGPQRVRWINNVTAMTHRHQALYQDTFCGHRDVAVLGSFPKEGTIFNRVKAVVPTVKAVHLPTSAMGRFHCYVSIDKQIDGEAKRAALVALAAVDTVKAVFVVDSDINVYREEEVLWALATRFQADADLDMIRNIKSTVLDPSLEDDVLGTKMMIDATRPVRRPYEARIEVPREAVQAVDLAQLTAPDQIARLGLA
jgi:2,5-furandicarboxylate decarboxylase 1